MYEEHPLFVPPLDKNARVWRYLDFTKLLSMLSTRSMYFARVDKLNDPFEGSNPKANVYLRQSAARVLPKEVKEKYLQSRLAIGDVSKDYRKHIAVNCWHMNEHESAAMWKLYLSRNEEGVAIQSTFKKLKSSFVCEEDVFVGTVKYIDYETDYIEGDNPNLLAPFMHKRISFSHEREVRALVSVTPEEHGKLLKVDLDALVERIYVAPNAADWFKELVKEVISIYGEKFEVVDSSLSNRPVF